MAGRWARKYGVGIPSLLDDPSKAELDEVQRLFLSKLADFLAEKERSEDEIQSSIYGLSKELGLSTREAFKAVYLAILGEERGPKASTLIAALDRRWVIERFKYNTK